MRSVLPLEFFTNNDGLKSHIAVNAIINGKSAFLIVDTGASNCIIDLNKKDNFNLKPETFDFDNKVMGIGTQELEASVTLCEKLELGAFYLKNYPFVLLDLGAINDSLEKNGCSAIDGIIGADLLLKAKAVIDYESATILFRGNKSELHKKQNRVSVK